MFSIVMKKAGRTFLHKLIVLLSTICHLW